MAGQYKIGSGTVVIDADGIVVPPSSKIYVMGDVIDQSNNFLDQLTPTSGGDPIVRTPLIGDDQAFFEMAPSPTAPAVGPVSMERFPFSSDSSISDVTELKGFGATHLFDNPSLLGSNATLQSIGNPFNGMGAAKLQSETEGFRFANLGPNKDLISFKFSTGVEYTEIGQFANNFIDIGIPATSTSTFGGGTADPDFHDIPSTTMFNRGAGCSSTTHGYIAGGDVGFSSSTGQFFATSAVVKFPFSFSSGDVTHIGDLSVFRLEPTGVTGSHGAASPTHGYALGQASTVDPSGGSNDIVEKYPFANEVGVALSIINPDNPSPFPVFDDIKGFQSPAHIYEFYNGSVRNKYSISNDAKTAVSIASPFAPSFSNDLKEKSVATSSLAAYFNGQLSPGYPDATDTSASIKFVFASEVDQLSEVGEFTGSNKRRGAWGD